MARRRLHLIYLVPHYCCDVRSSSFGFSSIFVTTSRFEMTLERCGDVVYPPLLPKSSKRLLCIWRRFFFFLNRNVLHKVYGFFLSIWMFLPLLFASLIHFNVRAVNICLFVFFLYLIFFFFINVSSFALQTALEQTMVHRRIDMPTVGNNLFSISFWRLLLLKIWFHLNEVFAKNNNSSNTKAK